MDAQSVVLGAGIPEDVAALRWGWARELAPGSAPAAGPSETFVAEVASWMRDESRTVWTARRGAHAVGMVCLTEFQRMPSPAPAAGGCWGYLSHLYVSPSARGRGIGAALVAALLAAARSRRYSKVVLSPTQKSVSLYLRCGFDADPGLLMWRPAEP
ncbi:GNAT family N-acetyltransferase [Segniliparus rotundus]|nr:GNAT family N-acetyltransferase [Segniliparus rotundus]